MNGIHFKRVNMALLPFQPALANQRLGLVEKK
jgi:hypothetical protein